MPVHLSVRLSVTLALGQESRTVRDRTVKFGMWVEYENYGVLIFSCQSDLSLQSYCPFQSFSLHCKPMEACEQVAQRATIAHLRTSKYF